MKRHFPASVRVPCRVSWYNDSYCSFIVLHAWSGAGNFGDAHVQWQAPRKSQKADDAVSLNLWSSSLLRSMKSCCEMRCCAAAELWHERAPMTLCSCLWRCLCVFRICSIMRLTPQGSYKRTEGISLNWVFQHTLCRISLRRRQVRCLVPSVTPCGVAATWLVFAGLNVGHRCRRVRTSLPCQCVWRPLSVS